jgi:hypothetical protein
MVEDKLKKLDRLISSIEKRGDYLISIDGHERAFHSEYVNAIAGIGFLAMALVGVKEILKKT